MTTKNKKSKKEFIENLQLIIISLIIIILFFPVFYDLEKVFIFGTLRGVILISLVAIEAICHFYLLKIKLQKWLKKN